MKKPIGYYNYTVVPTYIGFACALVGMFLAVGGFVQTAVFLLIASGICDMFDGKIARTRKRTDEEKAFGIQIDSLADMVSFGVLPAVIGWSLGMQEWYFYPILFLFPLCALMRLGYFNVQEACRQQTETGTRKTYLGLPVTVGSIFFAFLYLVSMVCGFVDKEPILSVVWAAAMVLVAALFITPFQLKKPGTRGIIGWAIFGVCTLVAIILVSVLA